MSFYINPPIEKCKQQIAVTEVREYGFDGRESTHKEQRRFLCQNGVQNNKDTECCNRYHMSVKGVNLQEVEVIGDYAGLQKCRKRFSKRHLRYGRRGLTPKPTI